MHFWDNLPGFVSVGLPGVVAFVLSLVGTVVSRRAEGRWPGVVAGVVAGAVLVGWMLLVPVPRAWVMPRVVMEHLVLPSFVALVGAVAAGWVRGRLLGWVGVVVLGVAAWSLAGSGVGRVEFWRVWFGVVGVAWLLRAGGARVVGRGVLVGATLLLGLLLSGAALVWSGVALVLFGAWLGVVLLRPGAVAGVVVLAAGIVAVDLGTGVVVRGRVGFMDLVCVAAMLAPGAAGGVERLMGRFGAGAGRRASGRSSGRAARRPAGGAGMVGRFGVVRRSAGVVMFGVGVAWGVSRFIRI